MGKFTKNLNLGKRVPSPCYHTPLSKSMYSTLYHIFWCATDCLLQHKFHTKEVRCTQGIWKGESGLFLTPVLKLWGSSHFDGGKSYCTSGVGMIIRHNLRTLSLMRVLLCNNLYAYMAFIPYVATNPLVVDVQGEKISHLNQSLILQNSHTFHSIVTLHNLSFQPVVLDGHRR